MFTRIELSHILCMMCAQFVHDCVYPTYGMYICSICNRFGGQSFAAVLRHIGEIHRYDPSLSIRCGINRCPQTYTNFESFRSHVYRKHRDVFNPVSHVMFRQQAPLMVM